MGNFDVAFGFTLGAEGSEWDTTRADTGNWTSGIVGVGELKGSKFGISAASYPNEDIKNLTLDSAKTIYKRDYWDKFSGDALPNKLAYVVFDAAVNNGVDRAIRWLQATVGVLVDGRVGPATIASATHGPQIAQIVAFMAARTYFMGCLPSWKTFPGWSKRLAQIPFNTAEIKD